MIKLIAVGLSIALSSGLALAQVPQAPGAPKTPDAPKTPKTDEKAGSDESLQKGGDQRPWAAGVQVDDQKFALEKFRQGNIELNDGLFKSAAKLYREALVHWDHPAINYNLALALLNMDQPIEVYDSLEKAIKFGSAPLEKDKFEHAKEYMLLVKQQIAEIDVSCAKAGAKVSVDGKEVFTVKAGEPGRYVGRVRVGKHTFVAEKPGYNAQVDAPFIGPGEPFRIELTLYTAEELTRYRRKWNKTWMPYAVVGGGLAVGMIGGVLSLSAKSSYEEFDTEVSRCNAASMSGGCTDASVMSIRDSGDTKKTLGYIGYAVAGGALVTGLVMAYMNRNESYQITADEYRRQEREKAAARSAVTFTPVVGPDMSGAMVHGSF
jgi:hypothetical protein